MLKRLLFLGSISGVLAGIVSIIFQNIYSSSVGVDFSNINKPLFHVVVCVATTIVASLAYWMLYKWLKKYTQIVFNLTFVTLSFASILIVFGIKLPLDTPSPELFPGLMIPIHFFPVLAWLTLRPLFIKDNEEIHW